MTSGSYFNCGKTPRYYGGKVFTYGQLTEPWKWQSPLKMNYNPITPESAAEYFKPKTGLYDAVPVPQLKQPN